MLLNLIFDFLLLLGGLGGLLLGLRRGFWQMVLSTIALLLATAFAALFATPVVRIFVERSGSQAETPIGIVFAGLLLAIYALLERLFRSSFPNTRIHAIGTLDNVLGFLVAPGWTLLALSLFVLVLAYTNFAVTGSSSAGLIGGWTSSSSLVPLLKTFFALPVNLMRFLFPAGLPQPLAFFAVV
ncbi:MAG TPA: CvpA family protein [Anaerolineae bacterium]|nr:CvpA family protein [Anaerolineae bacterium]